MFISNKYTKIYFQIIYKRKIKEIININDNQYFENHHIIPKSLSKDNSKDNLVRLTAREHFICHYLLTKMLNEKDKLIKMIYAFNMMNVSSNTMKQIRYSNSKLYKFNKEKLIASYKDLELSKEWRLKNKLGQQNSKYVRTEEHKQNLKKLYKIKLQFQKKLLKNFLKLKLEFH